MKRNGGQQSEPQLPQNSLSSLSPIEVSVAVGFAPCQDWGCYQSLQVIEAFLIRGQAGSFSPLAPECDNRQVCTSVEQERNH
jgi:hypothetical protein